MNEAVLTTLLGLFKFDLGVRHELRDNEYKTLLKGSKNELERMGVSFDLSSTEDLMLISDYASWSYRKRQEDVPLSRNIKSRINNRIIQKAAKKEDEVFDNAES